MPPRSQYPLRMRYSGTDPVHGARSRTDGHVTACWLWLDSADPHIWCDGNAEITCTRCIERLGPPPFEYPTPGTVGTLQERLAEIIENEVSTSYSELVGQRVAEAVENWRQEAETRIRLAVDEAFADSIPDATRFGVAQLLTAKMLRSMDVGSSDTGEEVKGIGSCS